MQVKIIVFLSKITFILLFMGCAHVQVEEAPRTIVSDLFPEQITRTEYYRQLAWGYDRDGKLPEAIELYRLALMHDPKNILAKVQLSDVFRKEKIDHLASAQLTEVLKLQPNHISALKKLGDLYLENQIYSKALSVYQNLIRLDAADEKSMWAIYFIYKLEKKYILALAQLDNIKNRVLPQALGSPNALNSSNDSVLARSLVLVSSEKAAIHRLTKDWVLEQKYLIAANQLQPNEYAHVNLLADSYFRFKNWPDAAALLGRFTDTNDYSFEISEKLAFASIQIKNYEIALREYRKQKPWYYDAYVLDMKIAHTYFLMKDYNTAEKKYLVLLQQRDDEEAKYYLSKIYQITDRTSESIALLEEMSPTSEYYGEAQIELADFENKKGLFNEAINRMRKAHFKRPDLLVVYKRYGDLMIENKRFVETIALLEQGIGFYPEDEELRYKLAFLHYHMNNQRSFKKQLNKAMQIKSA